MSRDNSRSHNPWEEPPRESSYEAHLRLKRLKQRARQSKSNSQNQETPATGPHPGSQARRPSNAKDTNATSPRQGPPQPRQRPLPSEQPFEENNETGVPSRRYRSPSSRPEMYTEDIYDEDIYDRDAPMPPARGSNTYRQARHAQRPHSTGGQNIRPSSDLEWEETEKSARRPRPVAQRRATPRSRGFGSVVLIGSIGGLIALGLVATILIVAFLRTPLGGNLIRGITSKTYTQQNSQPLQISNLKLAQIHNQVGNVTVTVSSSVSTPTLTTVKKVTASSNSAANSEFARIVVSEQTAGPTLTVNGTVPGSGNSSSGDAVDITLTLPPSSGTTASASITFNVATVSGNVNIQQVELAASSCLQVQQGNVTFNGTLDTVNGTTLIPCQNASTSNPHPWYIFHSEVGNVDVTLPAGTNITLDAATNVGSIDGTAFGLNIPTSDNSASYHGPLANGSQSPPAELKLDVGTGTIRLHKA